MTAFWTQPDFDAHEMVHFVHDRKSGLTAIIAVHSSHLGPGAGGTRFWHYADPAAALRDALRLSRGMSYKNAMAGLPLGGGKAVILADENRTKTPAMLEAFGAAIEGLCGQYVTAEDVGISEADMVTVASRTEHVTGLPVRGEGLAGGDPGPFTAIGIAKGIEAAVRFKLGKDSVAGVHVAVQGTGSVGGGVARLLAQAGARLTLADIDAAGAQALAAELGAETVPADAIMTTPCDVFSPNALGAILDEDSIARLDTQIVAGGANNQLARAGHGRALFERGILYAPDYVINAGGIMSVGTEYLARRDGRVGKVEEVHALLDQIPGRLEAIWRKSDETRESPDIVADRMAQQLIGRA
ncbi:Glu/Leu/Phe/Val dehydrogenase [Erythrobacter sp. HL-111]|uniref:Glu/Leu/Phe/Val family dehydrogenase n=1 Tax=Erythrobacter sp. HL-111 TaxID=1798193 RepID=UPI0006D94693|nr:Glu/Leu/Phe/Val dehydrogenase dimerization domain-containing protein [Erythrobacter sp. HL-111]KPP96207.1 MAG: leucine dehydrogenase Ldh [Erythrobacteraceae bacterium HL-111]SDR78046.1 leucine dehydrogenase [Erythrobacter sp. HL-111]